MQQNQDFCCISLSLFTSASLARIDAIRDAAVAI